MVLPKVICSMVATVTTTTNAASFNCLAGTWNLTALTITSSRGAVTRPAGNHPYGRLVLTPDFYFVSQFNSGDYASHLFHPSPQLYVPGTNADNAAVVRNSLGLSGTYRLGEHGQYLGLTTTGSTIPNFIASSVQPPNSTFRLMTGNEAMVETLKSEDGSVVEYHWSRLEVL